MNLTTVDNRNLEAGLFHVAYLLPTRSDLADFLYHANNLNIAMGGGDHLVSEALYFTDPEGNGIEVYHDRPSEDWVARRFCQNGYIGS